MLQSVTWLTLLSTQLDQEVLDALPPELRKEVQAHYRPGQTRKIHSRPTSANHQPKAASSSRTPQHTSPAARTVLSEYLSPSQWDESFLSELPKDVVVQMKAEARQAKARRAEQQRQVEQNEELLLREGIRRRSSVAAKRRAQNDPDDNDDNDDNIVEENSLHKPKLFKPTLNKPAKLAIQLDLSKLPQLGPASPTGNASETSTRAAASNPAAATDPAAPAAATPLHEQVKRLVMPQHAQGVVGVTVTGLPHLLGCTDVTTMAAILKDWVLNNYTGATPDKVAALQQLVVALCQHKRLEALLLLLRSMRRYVARSPSLWQQCYQQLVGLANQQLEALFSIRLPL